LRLPPPPSPTLFPYTTLFRSFTVGVLRAMDAPLRDWWQADSLDLMQQVPYAPPNVAGWEGGLSWLNTNTVRARFDLIVRCQQLKDRKSTRLNSSHVSISYAVF